jgi:hypothetical protein
VIRKTAILAAVYALPSIAAELAADTAACNGSSTATTSTPASTSPWLKPVIRSRKDDPDMKVQHRPQDIDLYDNPVPKAKQRAVVAEQIGTTLQPLDGPLPTAWRRAGPAADKTTWSTSGM